MSILKIAPLNYVQSSFDTQHLPDKEWMNDMQFGIIIVLHKLARIYHKQCLKGKLTASIRR